ncbi:MAG: conjugal transfer protein TraL [Oscillospiraceae bacterium]|nr:conjugal transfer protein TraL [Oscillospiraceae bacterium]
MDYRVIVLLILEAALALFLLWRSGVLKTRAHWLVCVGLTVLAFVLRALVLDYETLDYQNFLAGWVDFYRTHGGWSALRWSLGNYNIPYLYFLALISYSGIRDLYLIKLLSILFDVLLAWGGLRLCARLGGGPRRQIACFFTLLLLPTVFLNGALWGQCDSIYVALAVLALALALEDKPVRSMICLALSFGFKLQAVFVIPVFAVLLFNGKLKWYHLPVFPLTYVLLVLPAVFTGRPFIDTLTLYLSQTGSIGSGLNYNSSSIFAIFWNVQDPEAAASFAVIGAFVYLIALLALAFRFRSRLNGRAVLLLAVLMAVGIPFLLPHMHDRYFFAADALTVALAFSLPEAAPAALLTQFASLLGYHAYLKMRFFLPMQYGAWALIAALLLCFVCLVAELHAQRDTKDGIRNSA